MFAFGTGILFAIPTQDATGAAIANGTPAQFGTLQDVSGDISFEQKLLYGQNQFPVAVGRGKGKLTFKAKTAGIFARVFSDLLLGTPATAGIKAIANNVSGAVPASTPWTVTPTVPGTGTWLSDMGVIDASTGLPMTKVASAPTTGQYSVAAGVYTFAAADANKAVFFSFEYSATSTTAKIITISNQLMGYAPTFKAALNMNYSGKNMTLVLNQCISSKLSLPFKNDDFTVPEFDFDAFADASGNIGYVALTE